jgi:heme O synthase-like polyprenyltransferase
MSRTMLACYWELTKPGITALVLVTTTLGFFLGGMGIHSALLGLGMLAAALRMAKTRSALDARRLFGASILYLPLLLALSAVDATF